MENKMTAVEWLVEQLPLIQQEGLRDVIEQAKEMEKQQIMDAVDYGPDYNRAKDYYDKTFKK